MFEEPVDGVGLSIYEFGRGSFRHLLSLASMTNFFHAGVPCNAGLCNAILFFCAPTSQKRENAGKRRH